MNKRPAKHAGTWYTNRDLGSIEKWMESGGQCEERPKAILVPHAGYSYSGQVAAQAYKLLRNQSWKQIILLGPTHHAYIEGASFCGTFDAIGTPFGDLKISPISGFPITPAVVDVNEHSLEMQYPMLKYVAPETPVIPFLVGSRTNQLNDLLDEDTLLVISSDFCHYGKRFGYTPNLTHPIWQGIQQLDLEGFDAIRNGNFSEYLKRTKNTICGRYPIEAAMKMLRGKSGQWHLISYEQSEQLVSPDGSSVSYLAAAFY